MVAAWSISAIGSRVGALEFWEYIVFDAYMRYRPARAPDPRIAIVTIDEEDLFDAENDRVLTEWPLPDEVVLETLKAISRHEPRAIGLHLYLPPSEEPERARLQQAIATTEHLIGMEKVVGSGRQAPSLFPREQLGMSDMVLDGDGTVRRGLIAIYDSREKSYLSWGAQLAVEYLAEDGITPERQETGDVRFGRGLVRRLEAGEGGYSPQLDTGGFQVMMDFRGGLDAFETVSLRDVRSGNFDPELFRDRIVAIGPVSSQLKRAYRTPVAPGRNGASIASLGQPESFLTPDFGSNSNSGDPETAKLRAIEPLMSSLTIHLNLTSQLLDRALLGRPGLGAMPDWVKWGWMAIGAWLGTRNCLIPGRSQAWRPGATVQAWFVRGGQAVGVVSAILGVGFVSLWLGWWLPTVAPILAFAIALGLQSMYRSYRLYRWASYDALTGVGNRRLFDATLRDFQQSSQISQQPLAAILCDVDWFKSYNDTYGHQRGDRCLERVARAISSVTRPSDIVARYGGEEFVVLLPNTAVEGATALADRLCNTVRDLQIEHRQSPLSACLTLSCGVAVWYPKRKGNRDLIAAADRALYRAKDSGRNTWKLETPSSRVKTRSDRTIAPKELRDATPLDTASETDAIESPTRHDLGSPQQD